MSTLAEQVVEQLKTDMDNVYDAGYQKGLKEIGVNDGIEKYARQLQLTSLNIFGKREKVLYLDSATNLSGMCTVQGQNNPNINTTLEHLTINCPNLVTTMTNMLHCDNFCVDHTLKRVTLNVDTQKVTSFGNAFNNLQALEVIDGYPLDLRSSTNNGMFIGCISLIDVRFVPNTIPKTISFSKSGKLSDESIQSIIGGLADLTGQTSQTLTFHADVKAKLTEEQIATITSKNWTLA